MGNFGCPISYLTAVYFTQAINFWASLAGDSPLLSYIDVWHPNFLPPNLAVGKAWDLGPRLVRANSLLLGRGASANFVFQGRAVHISVKEPHVEVQPTDQEEAESVNSLSAKDEQAEGKMVVRRNMTAYRFLPGGRPV